VLSAQGYGLKRHGETVPYLVRIQCLLYQRRTLVLVSTPLQIRNNTGIPLRPCLRPMCLVPLTEAEIARERARARENKAKAQAEGGGEGGEGGDDKKKKSKDEEPAVPTSKVAQRELYARKLLGFCFDRS